MKLTILICVHTKSDFYDSLLIEALHSLENQTFKNFKTILVLDECWIKTKQKIISSGFDLTLSILEKEKKSGLAAAKNFGLQFVDTEWVGFLDGDDFYLPTKLEKQMDFIGKNDVDFLGCHCWNIIGLESEKLIQSCFDENEYNTHNDIEKRIQNENVLTHGSLIIKKSCLDKLNGYSDIKGMEDWDLWKRAISNNFTFFQLPERLYVYRLNTSVPR